METSNKDKKEFTLKQKVFLYSYKLRQHLNSKWLHAKEVVRGFLDSLYFYLIVFAVVLFLFHKALLYFNVSITEGDLHSLAFAIAGIIGTSIAIIFSFSTFILQSTADLFSTQYLNKFVKNVKEKIFFWLLVFLTLASFFAPIFLKTYVLEILAGILFISFCLIYTLYKELRERINPETTLGKIRQDAIKELEKTNKQFRKHAYIQNKIFEYNKEDKDFSLAVQYKASQNWHSFVLKDIKYLFEIGLRLLAKNEINSFNLTVEYIHDIYLKHLSLRNGHFIRIPASLWGAYSFDDEGFTAQILEYLQSMSDRIIQDKRKENIYYLLKVYESLLTNSLSIEYADKALGSHKGNPLLSFILAYYIGLVEKLSLSKDNDWIWQSIRSVSNVSRLVLQRTDDYFVCSQINQVIGKFSISCLTERAEPFFKELVNIYFNQIRIAWNRYEHNEIFWEDLFKELKKNVLLLSVSSSLGLSVSELFIGFHSWQVNVINWIIELEGEKEKKEHLDKFMQLLTRWSDFLLDFARDTGLQNKQVGLPIIQSVDNNLRIIYGIQHEFAGVDLKEIYKTQFNALSWYFQKTDKAEESLLINLEQTLKILLREIDHNLKHGTFDAEGSISLYIRLIEQHFEKVTLGYGYNHPRVIEKLVYLGLLLHKNKKTDREEVILAKIDELNKKYLELNKEFLGLKRKEKSLMGTDEFQLCKELHDLKNNVFSYNGGHLMDMKNILKEEITEDDWDGFTKKINHCKDIKYKTRHIF